MDPMIYPYGSFIGRMKFNVLQKLVWKIFFGRKVRQGITDHQEVVLRRERRDQLYRRNLQKVRMVGKPVICLTSDREEMIVGIVSDYYFLSLEAGDPIPRLEDADGEVGLLVQDYITSTKKQVMPGSVAIPFSKTRLEALSELSAWRRWELYSKSDKINPVPLYLPGYESQTLGSTLTMYRLLENGFFDLPGIEPHRQPGIKQTKPEHEQEIS